MDRRSFLAGLTGVAGTALIARPSGVAAGIPTVRGGILDELNAPEVEVLEDEAAEVLPASHRRRRRRRRRRRQVWRRVCSRFRHRGRWRYRCYRRRFWVYYYYYY